MAGRAYTQQASTSAWWRKKRMTKPTKEQRTSTSFMRGYNDAQRGKSKENPFTSDFQPSHDNYNKGYASGTRTPPRKGFL